MHPLSSPRTFAVAAMGLLAAISLLNGCATLHQDECVRANWRSIGFIDGSQGKLASHVRKHLKACAKYGIQPDLTAYQGGHRGGVNQFCTEPTGFNHGLNGKAYNGICPPSLEDFFLTGYYKGRQLSLFQQDIQHTTDKLSDRKRELERVTRELNTKKRRLRDTDAESERVILQREIDRLRVKQGDLEFDLGDLKFDYSHQNFLKRQHAR